MPARIDSLPLRALAAVLSLGALPTLVSAEVIDDFRDPKPWKALASDQVSATLRPLDRALCLDYDFNGVSGHAAMRRTLPIAFPADYAFDFEVRGSGPANQFEFKLIDDSGDNVWWVSKPSTTFPSEWTPVRYKKRHISPAWGPLEDKTLRRTQFVEFTIYANTGGKGEVCLRGLRLAEREPAPATWPTPKLTADAGRVPAGLVGTPPDDATTWRTTRRAGTPRTLTIDFTRPREFGALTLHWADGAYASRYDVEASDDGRRWHTLRRVERGNGGVDHLLLTESEARRLRLVLHDGPGSEYALAAIDVQDIAVGATPNTFLQAIAADAPRGQYPRGFSGEQTYWTLVGIDGGHESGLIGEDGAIEVARGGFSITPFVRESDAEGAPPRSWADIAITQRLADAHLPMPGVRWDGARDGTPSWHLDIDAFAQGDTDTSRLFATYTLSNDTDAPRTLTLALAVQPFQVNPPVQFLTTPGGVSPIRELGFDGRSVNVDGKPRVWPLVAPTSFFATPFDQDMVAQHLSYARRPEATFVRDDTGLASGALVYRLELEPRASRTITLDIPLSGSPRTPNLPPDALQGWVDVQRGSVAAEWRAKLDRVKLAGPAAMQPLVDTLRTSLAHVLINRDGVKIRPGTRSYARSWIRDGAMTSEALLRMGHATEAREFLEWYAPFQFANGKVPCCVDARGSDPVPENDSHGELAFLAAEVARYTQDRALAEAMWPHVDKATRYMDELRASERTDANRGTERYGLLPPSISHEGYSAKPAYSHWDNFWGLIGYTSAETLARQLDRDADATRLALSRDAFRADILASLDASAKRFGITFIPGAADLGDFDATSTTMALSPGGEREHLPPAMLEATFERYWREFIERRDGQRAWKDYTPYEWRNVSAFVRLGWRGRAHEAITFFFGDRRPQAWNQWAEVVGRDAREPRFIGDMPHGWVASDFIRAALDLFAYERVSDRAIVLGGGLASDWIDATGITLDGLHTPYGVLGYTLRRDGERIRLSLRGDAARVPPGGWVLTLPPDLVPARTRVDGRNAAWKDGELRLTNAKADVVVTLAKAR